MDHRVRVCYVQTRVCSVHSGSRAPDAWLQAQVRSAEPGPGDPGRLSAAGRQPRAQGTQIWSTLKLLVGLRTVGWLKMGESRGLGWIWSRSRGEGGELGEWSSRGWRRWGRKSGGGPLRLVWLGFVRDWAHCRWRRCDVRAPQRLSQRGS